MHAKLISKCTGGYIIEVDEELMRQLAPSPDNTKPGEELRLHSYIQDAEKYSYALKQFKQAIGVLAALATNDFNLKGRS